MLPKVVRISWRFVAQAASHMIDGDATILVLQSENQVSPIEGPCGVPVHKQARPLLTRSNGCRHRATVHIVQSQATWQSRRRRVFIRTGVGQFQEVGLEWIELSPVTGGAVGFSVGRTGFTHKQTFGQMLWTWSPRLRRSSRRALSTKSAIFRASGIPHITSSGWLTSLETT